MTAAQLDEMRALLRDLAQLDHPGDTAGRVFARHYAEHRNDRLPVEIRALIQGSTVEGAGTGGAALTPAVVVQRPNLVGDLIPRVPVANGVVPYVRELNAAANETGASATAEGSAKAEVTIEFEGGETARKKVTAWVPATVEVLDDGDALAGYIDTRLVYLVRVAEDRELLNGDGTGENMLGILNDPDIQTQTFTTDTRKTVTAAIRKAAIAGAAVDALVMHPTDLWGLFDADSGYLRELAELGIRPVWSVGQPAGTALVGAFATAATIAERKPPRVKVANQHWDYFVKNKLAIVAELREDLVLFSPASFVSAALS